MTISQASSTFSVLVYLLGLGVVICLLFPSFLFLFAVFNCYSLISFPHFFPAFFVLCTFLRKFLFLCLNGFIHSGVCFPLKIPSLKIKR